MQFFTSGLFWFLEGIILCLVIIGLRIWTDERHIPMPFWKWLFILAWIFWSGFAIVFVGTSLGENESTAALWGGILIGLISIISAPGIWILLRAGKKSKSGNPWPDPS